MTSPVLSWVLSPRWYPSFFPSPAFPSFTCLLITWVTNRNVLFQIRWQTSLIRSTDNFRGWGHSWDWFEVCNCFVCLKMDPFFGVSLINILKDLLWVFVCACACFQLTEEKWSFYHTARAHIHRSSCVAVEMERLNSALQERKIGQSVLGKVRVVVVVMRRFEFKSNI